MCAIRTNMKDSVDLLLYDASGGKIGHFQKKKINFVLLTNEITWLAFPITHNFTTKQTRLLMTKNHEFEPYKV